MIRVKREDLISALQEVSAGVASKEILEQSDCFIFQGKELTAYNDELCVRTKNPLPGFEGAVKGAKFLEILSKLPDDDLEVENGDGHLTLKGKGRKTRLASQKDILLPLDAVERPKAWQKLHEDFADACNMVVRCAASSGPKTDLGMVRIGPKWIEATDSYQLCRWRLLTGLTVPTYVRSTSLKQVASLGMTDFAEGDGWLHFRNSTGLTLAARRYEGIEFPDLSPHLKVDGQPATLPKGIVTSTDIAAVFSSEDQDNNLVWVSLKPGRATIKGVGLSGEHTEVRKVKYDGPAIQFLISPQLLMDVVERHPECQISAERLKVSGASWTLVLCLGVPAPEGKGGDDGDS